MEAFDCGAIPGAFATVCKLPPYCETRSPVPGCSGGGSGGSGGGPGGSGGGPGPVGCSAGEPVNLSTGDTFIVETDVQLPGLGGGLSLIRTWNSVWPATEAAYQIGMFGPNWRSTYEERVYLGTDGYVKYARSDGTFWSLVYYGGVEKPVNPWNAPVQMAAGSSYWTMTFKDGQQRLFDNNSGKLTTIIDRNGNATQLTYDSLGRLTTVADPASRHLYFNYGSGSYLVSSVTSDFGVSASYSYDGQGRLNQVTEPDGSTLSYQYDSNSYITTVLDSNSKVLEAHTYDTSGRGLSSSKANGVEAVTITYPPQ